MWYGEQGARGRDGPPTSPTTSTTCGEVAGIDAIGIGGDYDGVPTMGEHLTDVSTYPLVFAELRDRGYTDEELQQIAGRNVLRLMRSAEVVARAAPIRARSVAGHDRAARRGVTGVACVDEEMR